MALSYFGVEVIDDAFVSQEAIESLPFYDFWLESASGSTMLSIDNKNYIYLHDWEAFCKLFIKTGKHRHKE